MRQCKARQPDRAGFTIVELLVAMALIVFIMYVLTEAFSAGSKAFRDLKAIGDMSERLRSATGVLRRYLAADHFEGRKRLSDPNFWEDGPPKEGFVRIWQSDGGSIEGYDLDNFPSFRSNGHHLHFTVKMRGNQRGDFFRAIVPNTSPLLKLPQPDSRYQDGTDVFASQWIEVAVFLKGTGETTEDPNAPSGSPRDLHALHLRQRLLVPSREDVDAQGMVPDSESSKYPEVSHTIDGGNLVFNSPAMITMPARRFANTTGALDHPVSPGSYPTLKDDNIGLDGSDVLLTDVISMDIRVLLGSDAYAALGRPEEFVDFHETNRPAAQRLIENLYLTKRPTPSSFGTARVFDTWSSRKDDKYDYTNWNVSDIAQTIPMWTSDHTKYRPIRIRAIQITLRIWDSRTKQSRQVSIIQDL